MRISNIDALSAYLDRLVTERIKWYFFTKERNEEKIQHQKLIILEIRKKISELFHEIIDFGYNNLQEQRTFNFMNDIELLTIFDIEIGESDRRRLEIIEEADWENNKYQNMSKQESRLRTANELRSQTKNNIDLLTGEIFGE